MSHLRLLAARGIAKPPRWLPENLHYETIMGSTAYGISTEGSDWDIYGFAIPPRDNIFPHLQGEIPVLRPANRAIRAISRTSLTRPQRTQAVVAEVMISRSIAL